MQHGRAHARAGDIRNHDSVPAPGACATAAPACRDFQQCMARFEAAHARPRSSAPFIAPPFDEGVADVDQQIVGFAHSEWKTGESRI